MIKEDQTSIWEQFDWIEVEIVIEFYAQIHQDGYNSELIVRDSGKHTDLINKSLDLIFRNPPH